MADPNLIEAMAKLAKELPPSTIDEFVELLRANPSASALALRGLIEQRIPHHHFRSRLFEFMDHWHASVSSDALSLAISTAAYTENCHRHEKSVELVWTGPESDSHPFRRTEQAILQVLDSATQKIMLVSFAVYKIPNIAQALVRAARRQVQIDVIVETPNKIDSDNEYNTIAALGREVADCSTVYFWPIEQRHKSNTGKPGILHVKCAVADGHWLFLSSANLTEYAFTVNMELGVLLTGGSLPRRVQEHFEKLIDAGVLARV